MDAPAVWTEPRSFRDPDSVLGALEPKATARLIAAAGDITLAIDAEGIIEDVALGSSDLAADGAGDWIGRRWADTVTAESRNKIAEMQEDRTRPRRWRQVTHMTKNGETPVRYMAMDVRGDGRIVAIGRDLRAAATLQQRMIQAQQAMERDHLRLRQAETRYRMLFDQSGEAMLILDAGTRRILEANAAAERLAGLGSLVGQPYAAIAQERDREPIIAALGAASAVERATPVTLRMATGGRPVESATTLFRQGRQSFFLVRLSDHGAAARDDPNAPAILDRVPDPFVLTDSNLTIVAANAAFLETTGFARSEDLAGRPLADVIGRPGIDASLIAAQLREHGSLRRFSTVVFGRFGTQDDVEVSAVAAPGADAPIYGFTLRTAPARRDAPIANLGHPSSIEQLTQLVGRMSLKDIVRESTDLIERLCIEAALKYTQDNRASAAEILGLSRQGLYSKLNRFGMARAGAEDTE